MGDFIELTTWPKALSSFYKVTSNALTFEIKAYGNAAIGLFRDTRCFCDYWITIGEGRRCYIRKIRDNNEDYEVISEEFAENPVHLNPDEYHKFWIAWYNGQVQLGRDGCSNAIVSCQNDLHDINYFALSAIGERSQVQWRFEIAPKREQVQDRVIYRGNLHWVRYEPGAKFIDEPLVGGYEKEKLFIIRAIHNGCMEPGKFVPSAGKAYISWGGRAVEKTDFEVLCGFAAFWVQASEDKIPVDAVSTGISQIASERPYIGRAEYNGHLIPGKVVPSHKVCYFSYEGREVPAKNYEILVVTRTASGFDKMKLPNRVRPRGNDDLDWED